MCELEATRSQIKPLQSNIHSGAKKGKTKSLLNLVWHILGLDFDP